MYPHESVKRCSRINFNVCVQWPIQDFGLGGNWLKPPRLEPVAEGKKRVRFTSIWGAFGGRGLSALAPSPWIRPCMCVFVIQCVFQFILCALKFNGNWIYLHKNLSKIYL